jgi:hypothetical protein
MQMVSNGKKELFHTYQWYCLKDNDFKNIFTTGTVNNCLF